MLKYNNEELVKRYGTKHKLRGNRLKMEDAYRRKKDIIRSMRIRLYGVVAVVKIRMKSSKGLDPCKEVKNEKKLKFIMRARYLIDDVATSTEKFYAWRMKREQEVKDRLRNKRKGKR